MSRRALAPLLLLFAAAGSIAAVFAVHQIEAEGGPLSEPSVTQAFSPTGPDDRRTAVVRFTTKREERITITLLDRDGDVVRTLLSEKSVEGSHEEPWDGRDDAGRVVPDGTYTVEVRREGDRRAYTPIKPTKVDTVPPVAQLDAHKPVDDQLRGLVFLEPGARLIGEDANGQQIEDGFRANVTVPGTPTWNRRPPGTQIVRFFGPVDRLAAVVAVDAAGNRVELPLDLPAEPPA